MPNIMNEIEIENDRIEKNTKNCKAAIYGKQRKCSRKTINNETHVPIIGGRSMFVYFTTIRNYFSSYIYERKKKQIVTCAVHCATNFVFPNAEK